MPQEETIQHYLSKKMPSFEIVNFGVDGYGLGQAYLWFRELNDHLEYDHVILAFVAVADLWREVNVSHEIGQNWDSYMIYPRFVIEGESLQLVSGPYSNIQELINDNGEEESSTLSDHLKKYDALFAGIK